MGSGGLLVSGPLGDVPSSGFGSDVRLSPIFFNSILEFNVGAVTLIRL